MLYDTGWNGTVLRVSKAPSLRVKLLDASSKRVRRRSSSKLRHGHQCALTLHRIAYCRPHACECDLLGADMLSDLKALKLLRVVIIIRARCARSLALLKCKPPLLQSPSHCYSGAQSKSRYLVYLGSTNNRPLSRMFNCAPRQCKHFHWGYITEKRPKLDANVNAGTRT